MDAAPADRGVRAAVLERTDPGAMRLVRVAMLATVLLGIAGTVPVRAQEAGGTLVKRGTFADDLYLAGSRIDVLADVDGDVVAAGGRVSVGQVVRGDVVAAGGQVTVAGEMRDDVRVVGGAVDLAADVGGDAVAAGGSVSVTPETRVQGRAMFAGGEVDVRGRFGRWLRAAGGTVRVGAEVRGDVELAAGTIEVLPSARIEGNLTYHSPRPATIHPEARIAGTVTHRPVEAPRWSAWAPMAGWLVRIALVVSLVLAGVVLVLLFPGFTAGAVQTLKGSALRSLGLGFALWVATPVAAALLAATGVGIPLGVALAAAYAIALLAGLLVALAFVGAAATGGLRAGTRGRMLVSVVVGVVVLGIVMLLPLAGAAVMLLGLVWGLGALALYGHRLYAGHGSPAPV